MSDELLPYYERELTYLRQLGAEFAGRYPKIASRLVLEEDKCEDPHVERLLEAFAFLAARIHRKLDDELPEITESLLSVLYPHYLAPIPSMSVVQFLLDPAQSRLQTGQSVARESVLASKPWPEHRAGSGPAIRSPSGRSNWLRPVSSRPPPRALGENIRSVLKLELRVVDGLPLNDLREKVSLTEERGLRRLRFYLHARASSLTACMKCCSTTSCESNSAPPRSGPPGPGRHAAEKCILPVGFARNEGCCLTPIALSWATACSRSFFPFRRSFFSSTSEGWTGWARSVPGTASMSGFTAA